MSLVERHTIPVLLFLLLISGCRGGTSIVGSDSSHPLDSRSRIFAASTGKEVRVASMISDLAKKDVVFLGETHLDDVTHRIELAVIEGIHATGRPVVISMEMLGRNRQDLVDQYLAGTVDEDQFLEGSNPWGNYETDYRPMIEWAKRIGVPIVAANVPASVWRKSAFGGGLEALDENERSTIATDLLPNTRRYWQRYDRAVRGHGHTAASGNPEDRLEKVQSLWDNTMGESVARALGQYPGSVVVHINGGFHSLERDGSVHQLLLRKPKAVVATVQMVPTFDLVSSEVEAGDRRADWIVETEMISRGQNSGTLAFFVPRPMRYRIDAPARSAGAAPLLLWLPAAGKDPGSELKKLREQLGEEPCLVVVEQIYSAGVGGDWLSADQRDEDIATLAFGLDRLRQLLLEQRDIDPDRILIAGDQEGADVVASVTAGDSSWLRSFALTSGGPGWFGMEGLPERPDNDDLHPGPGLKVLCREEDVESWNREAKARKAVGCPVSVETIPLDVETDVWFLEKIRIELES